MICTSLCGEKVYTVYMQPSSILQNHKQSFPKQSKGVFSELKGLIYQEIDSLLSVSFLDGKKYESLQKFLEAKRFQISFDPQNYG